jgi:hypothetical protein
MGPNIMDDLELLGFGLCHIVWYSINLTTQRFGNLVCFRPQMKEKTPTLLSTLEGARLIH